MVKLCTAELAGLIMVVGILAIAGTNLAFAQNATSTPTTPTGTVEYPCAAAPSYGGQAYAYIACTPTSTAQIEGFAMVGGVVALSIACGASGLRR
jgi:hypothetical protein